VHWIPSGVDATFFAAAAPDPVVAAIPGPRVGFFGSLDHRLDLGLLGALAGRRPDWSFVLIGPPRVAATALPAAANLHYLGVRPHAELPACLAALDALFLPYVLDEFTRRIHPAKIYECLATGLPVVATDLPSLGGLGAAVRLVAAGDAHAAHAWEEALAAALAEGDPELPARRRALARANSWEARLDQIERLLAEVLARPETDP